MQKANKPRARFVSAKSVEDSAFLGEKCSPYRCTPGTLSEQPRLTAKRPNTQLRQR